jgi:hypothetical protein
MIAKHLVRRTVVACAVIAIAAACGQSSGDSSGNEDSASTSGGDDGAGGGDSAANGDGASATSGGGAAGDASGSSSGDAGSSSGNTGADTTGGSSSGAPDVVGAPDVDESKGLASKELLIKILGPSGRDWVQSAGQKVQLSGVLFGQADKASWKTSSGKSGKIDIEAFWTSDIIDLVQGDNTITVEAEKGSVKVRDEIHIVYNPYFTFEGPPQIGPDLVFVNEKTGMIVHMPLSAAGTGAAGKGPANPNSVKLVQVDQAGKLIKDHGLLKDNGSAGNCDDIQKDGIFSMCLKNVSFNVQQTIYFRVEVDVEVINKKYKAKSPVAVVDVVKRVTPTECNSIKSLLGKVRDTYKVAAASDSKKAQADAIATLKTDASVAEAGPATDGYGVWVRFKSGRLGALSLAPQGVRGGGGAAAGMSNAALPTYSVGTRRALSLAPFATEFEKDGGDEAALAGKDLAARECPPFAVDQRIGKSSLLKEYRKMSEYGIIAISGHGDAYFGGMDTKAKQALGWEHLGSQEAIWTGEASCSGLTTSTKSCSKSGAGCPSNQVCVVTSSAGGVCVDHTQGDLNRGRVVIGPDNYAILPAFVGRHAIEAYPSSIVYLGTCRSLWNGSMAVQFYGNGASAVVGYSDYVSSQFASSHGQAFFKGIIEEGMSVLQALQTFDADPKHGGWMRMLGNSKANAKDGNLINRSWDLGRLTGWKKTGDGRVISRLGVSVPVAGKFMGIVSTGLGFTTQTGSLEQPFCVSPGKSKMCFFWKFYSEEFLEFCMSTYQDKFKATLVGKAGQKTVTDVWVDALCPHDCGGKSPCQPGSADCKCGMKWETLTPADVSFDKGGVYMTPWVEDCADIKAFEGKRVNLKFFTTDTGDSIYDSAVLIDEVTIK